MAGVIGKKSRAISRRIHNDRMVGARDLLRACGIAYTETPGGCLKIRERGGPDVDYWPAMRMWERVDPDAPSRNHGNAAEFVRWYQREHDI